MLCLVETEKQKSSLRLSASQQAVYEDLLRFIAPGNTCVLKGDAGLGKSTVLLALQKECRAAYVSTKDFLSLLMTNNPAALEETFLALAQRTMAENDAVFFDDFELLMSVVDGYDYPRAHLFNAVLTTVLKDSEALCKCLLFAISGDDIPSPIRRRAHMWRIGELTAEDYKAIGEYYLGVEISINWEEIHRFAPALNAYQIRNAARWLATCGKNVTTQIFTEHLQKQDLTSNVDLKEVAPVDWKDLKGADDVIRELEAKIALPFENALLSKELKLKPKRGVLLAGPPGTGKTTIGRALAHRLKSKFFLIDGTVIAGSSDFYETVSKIFEEAKKNAPAIIFIDDADVIFENGDRILSLSLDTDGWSGKRQRRTRLRDANGHGSKRASTGRFALGAS